MSRRMMMMSRITPPPIYMSHLLRSLLGSPVVFSKNGRDRAAVTACDGTFRESLPKASQTADNCCRLR
jgi:hypothetical protein